jgi:hypothetical protein
MIINQPGNTAYSRMRMASYGVSILLCIYSTLHMHPRPQKMMEEIVWEALSGVV